jgi:hypothetical protein
MKNLFKLIALFTIFYCLRSDGAYVSFEGMDQATITAMLAQQGLTCQWITQDEFTAAIAAQQAKVQGQ